ncbi:MAG: V4R domain-containing protein [Promethearchaeota archaeon]
MLHAVYILDANSGIELLDKQFHNEEEDDAAIDPTLISGLLNAIFSFSQVEIGSLEEVQAEDFTVVYRQEGDILVVALVESDTDKDLLENMLSSISSQFLERYPNATQKAYNRAAFMDFEEILNQIFYSEVLEYLTEDYPEKLVARVLKMYELYSSDVIEKHGAHVGGFIREKESGEVDLHKLQKELSKFSVVELNRENEKEKVSLLICPFCNGRKSRRPMCGFVTGFIKGFFDLPNKRAVTETHCFGCGHDVCSFSIVLE